MAAGLPDLVDCARLAEDGAVLERVYDLSELPRLQDVLAEPSGTLTRDALHLRRCASGRAGARVSVRADAAADLPALHAGFRVPGERRQ